VQEAVRQLCDPLEPYYSPGRAWLRINHGSTNYGQLRCWIEAFARPFWGLAPLAAGGGRSELWAICREGLTNGTDPAHPEFWGLLEDYDQLSVEMVPLAISLALAPEVFWMPLRLETRARLVAWLNQVSEHRVPDSNWLTFPVLVNVALKRLGVNHDLGAVEDCLARLEEFYVYDGWYSDGVTDRRDYYISFSIHFALLIYSHFMETEDPGRVAMYRERAAAFANHFIYWFTAEGAALPFGRSLTYRFAQGAFWGALAFADLEALPWGVIKGLYLRHLRHWFRLPICSSDGLLSIGYAYPNLLMSEYYNGPGSPYWAMKAFLPLSLSQQHPFWTSDEQPMPALKRRIVQPQAYMSISRSVKNDHVIALTSGQWTKRDFGHCAEKYSKFAYSTYFGFSVARESTGLAQGAYDSILALSDGEDYWRVRRACASFTISEDAIISIWKPWPDVVILTKLIDRFPWHFRIHTIRTSRTLATAEGAFAAPHEDGIGPVHNSSKDPRGAFYGGSGILNLEGDRFPVLVETFPNTNINFPRTVIPMLTGRIAPGEHRLVCMVLGEPNMSTAEIEWQSPPSLTQDD
jgi:hypothetical protein